LELSIIKKIFIPTALLFASHRAGTFAEKHAVGHGRHRHDKREAIKKKEMAREVRKAMTHRQ
jgi:tmRNA-binding protein